MEYLLDFDRFLFHKINQEWTSSWADAFFPTITDLNRVPWVMVPLFIGLLVLMIYSFRERGRALFVIFLFSLGVTDVLGGQLIKPLFARSRPEQSGLDVVVRGIHHSSYGFTSNHAANIFCAVVFLSFFFPKARWPLFLLAALIGYSRVYVGAHFPLDVLGGALLGSAIGAGFAIALKRSQINPLARSEATLKTESGESWQKS